MSYRVRVVVKGVKGSCASGFKLGDEFVVEKFYVPPQPNTRMCLHALVGISSLLLPFLKGVSARELGIGIEDDVGYVQCPDPGGPYTIGGTVVFELRERRQTKLLLFRQHSLFSPPPYRHQTVTH